MGLRGIPLKRELQLVLIFFMIFHPIGKKLPLYALIKNKEPIWIDEKPLF